MMLRVGSVGYMNVNVQYKSYSLFLAVAAAAKQQSRCVARIAYMTRTPARNVMNYVKITGLDGFQ